VGLLLALSVAVRPVVLAPLALRDALRDTRRGAPGTLNAGRGAKRGGGSKALECAVGAAALTLPDAMRIASMVGCIRSV
jgi:hypothetical protein